MVSWTGDVSVWAQIPTRFDSRSLLQKYGLRATRQRRGLAKLLFGKGDRHLTAETLAQEAHHANTRTSLATVYNVLNLFAQVGLVRSLAIEGEKRFLTPIQAITPISFLRTPAKSPISDPGK